MIRPDIETPAITLYLAVCLLNLPVNTNYLEEIDELNNIKSPGPDGVGPTILKDVTDVIARPLAYLDYLSFQAGLVPEGLKTGLNYSSLQNKEIKQC